MNCHELKRYWEEDHSNREVRWIFMEYRRGYAGTLQTKTMDILLNRPDTRARRTPLVLHRSDIADSRHLCSLLPHQPS